MHSPSAATSSSREGAILASTAMSSASWSIRRPPRARASPRPLQAVPQPARCPTGRVSDGVGSGRAVPVRAPSPCRGRHTPQRGEGAGVTVDLDVADRCTHVHALGASGEVVRERRVRTTAAALSTALTGLPWSRVVAALGHEVVVANPRQVALIARSQRKTDRLDAAWLARLGRFDHQLLAPIRHRSEQSQHDLAVVRARAALVRTRTLLINHVRGAVKACRTALPSCTAEAFHRKMAEHIPAGLQPHVCNPRVCELGAGHSIRSRPARLAPPARAAAAAASPREAPADPAAPPGPGAASIRGSAARCTGPPAGTAPR